METRTFKLLVVDDNEENRDVLSRRLRRRGFAVLVAEDGQRALELIEQEAIDLVLLDVMMPGLTGLDVLRILRERPATAGLPVIMATARSESEDVVEALGLGADDYVTKPLDFPVVLARVEALLRRRSGPPPARSSPGTIGPGTILAARYRLEARIGAGNFGSVYRATHLELESPVAVKVLQATVDAEPEAVARFRREGVAACRVRHPHAVQVLDFGTTAEGTAYLVMELLEGLSLDALLGGGRSLGPARAAEILIPVCEALAEAHRAGIVHRDVKPANIFLHRTPGGEVPKVLDFGIAKVVGETAYARRLTVDGFILGTPLYMAPERFRDQPYDGRADVYSLGVVLYEVLTGRAPFEPPQGDPMAVISMHLNRAPEPLSRLRPGVGTVVEGLVMRCLAKQPAERPTAADLAHELAAFAAAPQGEARLATGTSPSDLGTAPTELAPSGSLTAGTPAPVVGPRDPTLEPRPDDDPEGER